MPTPEQLQVRAIIRALNRVSERAIQKITHDITANLSVPALGSTTGTPVDLGWARANWIASIGDSVDEPVGTPENRGDAERAKQRGLAEVLRYRLRKGKVFISNNVPYIVYLNRGSSPQQDSGFVQRSIRKAVTTDFRGFRG